MAKAANISSGNSGQPDEDGHDSDRAFKGKSSCLQGKVRAKEKPLPATDN